MIMRKKYLFKFRNYSQIKKNSLYFLCALKRRHRLVWSRTPPFHGGNPGSNPGGAAKIKWNKKWKNKKWNGKRH